MSPAGRGQGKGDWKSRPFGAVAWEELLSFVVLGSYGWCTGLHSMDFFFSLDHKNTKQNQKTSIT